MNHMTLTDYVLTFVISYGPPVFALILLLGALGVPVPTTLLVVAAGAFVREGVMDGRIVMVLGLIGAVTGDSLSYGMGRYIKGTLGRRFGNSTTWLNATDLFKRRGSVAIYFTRFVLTPLAVPINLVAGGSSYHFGRFFVCDLLGEVTWLVLYGALGYVFGSQWELVGQFVGDAGGFAAGIALVGVGIYLWWRWHHHHATSRRPGA